MKLSSAQQEKKPMIRFGAAIITREDVIEGVPEMVTEVQIEATFPDGTKPVIVHDPIT